MIRFNMYIEFANIVRDMNTVMFFLSNSIGYSEKNHNSLEYKPKTSIPKFGDLKFTLNS